MLIKYNIDKLRRALNDFYNVTGIRLSFQDNNFAPIATVDANAPDFCKIIQDRYGNSKCVCNDHALFEKCRTQKTPLSHTCHAGLTDIAIPIVNSNKVLGYLILGQIRKSDNFCDIEKNLSDFYDSIGDLKDAYSHLILYDDKKIESLISLSSMLASYILSDNLAHTHQSTIIEKCIDYIDRHLTENITVTSLCKELNISKNSLYKYFDDFFACTVNQYITSKRLEKAQQMLLYSSDSIEDICEHCGFENYSYFCKLFKKHIGASPGSYRKKSLY